MFVYSNGKKTHVVTFEHRQALLAVWAKQMESPLTFTPTPLNLSFCWIGLFTYQPPTFKRSPVVYQTRSSAWPNIVFIIPHNGCQAYFIHQHADSTFNAAVSIFFSPPPPTLTLPPPICGRFYGIIKSNLISEFVNKEVGLNNGPFKFKQPSAMQSNYKKKDQYWKSILMQLTAEVPAGKQW